MCRFILGLLALSLDDRDLPCRPSRWDTLRFAPVVWTVVEGVSAELEDDLVGDEEDVVADVDLMLRGEGDRVREVGNDSHRRREPGYSRDGASFDAPP